MKKTTSFDWVASLVRDVETEEGKSGRWMRVGVGFDNQKSETITVLSDLFPNGMKLVLTRPKEEPEIVAPRDSPRTIQGEQFYRLGR